MDELAQFLSATELFGGVATETLQGVLPGMAQVNFAKGARVFSKGEPGDAVYVILQGQLRLEADGVHLVTRHRGECVGEFALIDEQSRSATAVADSHATLLRWDRRQFQAALVEHPEVARGIFRILTQKLREDIGIHVNFAIEKERFHQDLQRAREIQMGMLPDRDFAGESIEISGFCQPAVEVGGDYYDYVPMDGARLGVIIADVTGHGFYAGLFVAMAKSCLHTLRETDESPDFVMHAMRTTLSLSIQRRLLMSCCYVLFDPNDKTLCYANAGHPYPYLFRASSGELEQLDSLDPILGALDTDYSSYQKSQCEWHEGDILVMYTDGVTEKRNIDGRMFEHEPLEQLIKDNATLSAPALKEKILETLAEHSAGATPGDDLTLVVIKAKALCQ